MKTYELTISIHPLRDCIILLTIITGTLMAEYALPVIEVAYYHIGVGVIILAIAAMYMVLSAVPHMVEKRVASQEMVLVTSRRLIERMRKRISFLESATPAWARSITRT